MKKTVALIVCIALLTGLVSCSKQDKESSKKDDTGSERPVSDSSAVDDAPEEAYQLDPETLKDLQIGEFDSALIEYLCQNGYDPSNFVISPAAFRASLCLAAVGAQGDTRAEILNAAGFSGMDTLDSWYSSLDDRTAASVWCNKDLIGEFSDTYASKVANDHHADAYSLSSDELTKGIGEWAAKKTGGEISSVVEDVSGASAVLVSTLDLRSAWRDAFSEAAVDRGVFVGSDGSEQKIDFMEQTGEYLYAEENGVQVVIVPMEGNVSFVCFLGSRAGRFDKMASVQPEKVHVVLPRFEIESFFDSRDFLGFLLERGVNDAINSETANFDDMCSDSDWFMQEIAQKIGISANEEGISPSARSALVTGGAGSEEGSEVKEFIADGPFSFGIFSDLGTEDQHMLLYGQMMTANDI